MTTAKHTPGPWQVRSGIDGTPRMDSRDGYTVERADPTAGKPFVVSTWSLPNARLIAAAPDLIEALKGAIGALEFSRDYHADLSNAEQAFAQDRLDAALAALAKAEGQP